MRPAARKLTLLSPEFFRIAQLDQRESFRKVIIEGAFEDQRIGGKVVGAAPVAAVGIGKDNKPGIGRGDEGYGFDIILNNRHLLTLKRKTIFFLHFPDRFFPTGF